jgi:hypothetical protein
MLMHRVDGPDEHFREVVHFTQGLGSQACDRGGQRCPPPGRQSLALRVKESGLR